MHPCLAHWVRPGAPETRAGEPPDTPSPAGRCCGPESCTLDALGWLPLGDAAGVDRAAQRRRARTRTAAQMRVPRPLWTATTGAHRRPICTRTTKTHIRLRFSRHPTTRKRFPISPKLEHGCGRSCTYGCGAECPLQNRFVARTCARPSFLQVGRAPDDMNPAMLAALENKSLVRRCFPVTHEAPGQAFPTLHIRPKIRTRHPTPHR